MQPPDENRIVSYWLIANLVNLSYLMGQLNVFYNFIAPWYAIIHIVYKSCSMIKCVCNGAAITWIRFSNLIKALGLND